MPVKSANRLNAKINQDFMIRWRRQGESKTYLISAGQYHKIVGSKERAERHFKRALESTTMKHTILVKNSLQIDFIYR